MAGYNPDRPRRTAPDQVPGSSDSDTAAASLGDDAVPPGNGTMPPSDTAPPPSTFGSDDPTPAPVTRVLPRTGLPDRILLVAGSITAITGLVLAIGAIAWWRRHRITISRVTNQAADLAADFAADIVADLASDSDSLSDPAIFSDSAAEEMSHP